MPSALGQGKAWDTYVKSDHKCPQQPCWENNLDIVFSAKSGIITIVYFLGLLKVTASLGTYVPSKLRGRAAHKTTRPRSSQENAAQQFLIAAH